MKLDAPANPNYAAVVIKLPPMHALEGLDNLQAAPILGYQALLSKDHVPGELGIAFTAETQLSEAFCHQNDLFRHSEKNLTPDAKGYLEDSRRIKAIKLRGHRSDCLFMPLESLAYTGVPLSELKEGDTFDSLGEKFPICQKYVVRSKGSGRGNQQKQEKKFVRVDPLLFKEHLETANYWRFQDTIGPDEWVTVSQKVHGTSFRATRTLVKRPLSLRERLARRLGVKVQEQEWDAVAGSRKVIKDPHAGGQNHYYASDEYNGDIWTDYLAKVESLLPEGFVIYGELVGYLPDGGVIQANYDYCLPPKTCELYVYRVTMVNHRGVAVDLSWTQMTEFCRDRDLKVVPLLWQGWHKDFVVDNWIDKRFHDEGFDHALPLGPNKKLVDEGVCIRAEGLTPKVLKAKSPIFLQAESAWLDKGESDIESAESDDGGGHGR